MVKVVQHSKPDVNCKSLFVVVAVVVIIVIVCSAFCRKLKPSITFHVQFFSQPFRCKWTVVSTMHIMAATNTAAQKLKYNC